jgi:hypothetical protein
MEAQKSPKVRSSAFPSCARFLINVSSLAMSDGVTVAKAVQLEDKFENLGAK